MVTHDWDEEDYVKTLDDAFNRYRSACYGDRRLPPEQVREVKQAFMSGVLWLVGVEHYAPYELEVALREIVGRHNPHIKLPPDHLMRGN